jgi:hypothetical protein
MTDRAGSEFLSATGRSRTIRFLPWARKWEGKDVDADLTWIVRQVLEIGITVAVMVIGICVINYYRKQIKEEPQSEGELLAEFQATYDAGEIDAEEYERIRDRILGRAAKTPAPAAPAPANRQLATLVDTHALTTGAAGTEAPVSEVAENESVDTAAPKTDGGASPAP